MNRDRGFTLVEVLIVLAVMGLAFGSLALIISRGTDSSSALIKDSESFKLEVTLFWDLERKVLGAKRIKIEKDSIYMYTTGGNHFPGVVKCAYTLREGKLMYYEFPYPYGSIDDLEGGVSYVIGKVESFEVFASDGERDETVYDGIPPFVKVVINGREFVFETLGK